MKNNESAKITEILGDFKNNIFLRACAGSGKTRVLAAKYLVALFYLGSPQGIVAITFTEKAAQELKSRIQKFLKAIIESSTESELELRQDIPWPEIRQALKSLGINSIERIRELAASSLNGPFTIGTIHSFAKKMLDAYPLEALGGIFSGFDRAGAGLKDSLEDLSKDPIAEALQNLDEISFRQATALLQEVLGCVMSGMSSDTALPADIAADSPLRQLWGNFLSLIDQALGKSKEEGYLNYDLILYWMNQFVRNASPDVLSAIGARVRYILLDELQDTDPLQFEILFKLSRARADDPAKIFMVGDPLQSIYAFRGANSDLAFDFAKKSSFVQHDLLGNKRSGAKILRFINAIYAKSALDYAPMEAFHFDKNPDAIFWHSPVNSEKSDDRRMAEARHVASTIKDLAEKYKWDWRDFAVLLRKKTHAWVLEEAFRELAIPAILAASDSQLLTRSLAVREAYWLLMLFLNPENPNAGHYLAQSPLKDPTRSFENFYSKPMSLIRENCLEQASPGALVIEIKKTFDLDTKAGGISLEESRALEALDNLAWQLAGKDVAFFAEQLGNRLKAVAWEKEEEPMHWETPWEGNAVKIATVHQMKGLEFPCVVLAGLGDWALRSQTKKVYWEAGKPNLALAFHEDEALRELKEAAQVNDASEEERILYVALTRAQRALVIMDPALPGGPRGKSWSQKIKGMLENAKNQSEPFLCSSCQDQSTTVLTQKTKEPVLVLNDSRAKIFTPLFPVLRFASQENAREEIKHWNVEDSLRPEDAQVLGKLLHRALERAPWRSLIEESESRVLSQEACSWHTGSFGHVSVAVERQAQVVLDQFFASALWREYLVSKKLIARELPVAYAQDGSLVIGRVDLLYEDESQCLVVADYKTQAEDFNAYSGQGRCYVEAVSAWAAKNHFKETVFEVISLRDSKRQRLSL